MFALNISGYMSKYCGKTIKLRQRAELLSLTKAKTFKSNWSCTVTVKAPPAHVVRLQVISISLSISPTKCTHRLEIFNGKILFILAYLFLAWDPSAVVEFRVR
jgi:hypothetical protein